MNKIYYFIILTIVVLIIGTALSVKVKSLRSLFPFALGIFSIAISCYFWDASMWKSFAYTFAIIGVVLTLVGIGSSVRKIKKAILDRKICVRFQVNPETLLYTEGPA